MSWMNIAIADALCSGIEDSEFHHDIMQATSVASALVSKRKTFDQKRTLINCIMQEIMYESQTQSCVAEESELGLEIDSLNAIVYDIPSEWSSLTALNEFLLGLPVSTTKKMKEKRQQIVENIISRMSVHGALKEIINRIIIAYIEKNYCSLNFRFTFSKANGHEAYTHIDNRLTNFENRLEYIEENVLAKTCKFIFSMPTADDYC
jgi:ethanolamine utilization protein EutQ (cupin superfamily)